MTPDLPLAIANHNAEMKDWWRRPEYIKARKAFVLRNPICKRCGRPTQTPGHCHDDYQHGFENYLQRVIEDDCEPLCNRCNLNERKGKKPCQECVKQKKDYIRYIGQDQDTCFYCVPVGVQEARQKRSREFKKFVRSMQDADNARRRTAYQERKKAAS